MNQQKKKTQLEWQLLDAEGPITSKISAFKEAAVLPSDLVG